MPARWSLLVPLVKASPIAYQNDPLTTTMSLKERTMNPGLMARVLDLEDSAHMTNEHGVPCEHRPPEGQPASVVTPVVPGFYCAF